mmetsp:Transcript_21089/g.67219  ORF Transcript_21089/g.67219 Transcript_21089/m.67219 type:complete len:663 (+) Transcript_21089:261-2249(+)
MMQMLQKKKPNACQACYASRVRCTYGKESDGRCLRCAKNNRQCTPRIILRGHASKANKPCWDTTKSNDKALALKLDAFRSLGVFESRPEVAVHYSAAAACVKTYKSLGMETTPTSLKCLVNLLYLMAAEQKSMSRMHAATTLAVSTGTPIDVSFLTLESSSLTPDLVDFWDKRVQEKYFRPGIRGAFFIVRHEVGKRRLLFSPKFAHFFHADKSRFVLDEEAPHLSFWKPYVCDKQVGEEFSARMLISSITAKEPAKEGDPILYETLSDGPVDIIDNMNHRYTAKMFEEGIFVAMGYLVYMVFGFVEFSPQDDGARTRLAEFRALEARGQAAPVIADSTPHKPGSDMVVRNTGDGATARSTSGDATSLSRPTSTLDQDATKPHRSSSAPAHFPQPSASSELGLERGKCGAPPPASAPTGASVPVASATTSSATLPPHRHLPYGTKRGSSASLAWEAEGSKPCAERHAGMLQSGGSTHARERDSLRYPSRAAIGAGHPPRDSQSDPLEPHALQHPYLDSIGQTQLCVQRGKPREARRLDEAAAFPSRSSHSEQLAPYDSFWSEGSTWPHEEPASCPPREQPKMERDCSLARKDWPRSVAAVDFDQLSAGLAGTPAAGSGEAAIGSSFEEVDAAAIASDLAMWSATESVMETAGGHNMFRSWQL